MKTVIVGGVAGGASAAARLRRMDESTDIVLFERGPYISFANCGLPYYIGGVIREQDDLLLQTPEGFGRRFNVDVRVCEEVTSIDRNAKTVTVKKSDKTYTETYDTLILSPGAAPIKPPIPGIDNARVFTLRNVPDAVAIREYIEKNKPQKAVVAGGGFIGLEMAENLVHAGLEVTVVELADQLVPPMDAEMAVIIKRSLEGKGVKVLLKNGVKAISADESAPKQPLHIELSEGAVDADLLIMSVGVRPETGLAKNAGLECNERGCIKVDAHMKTSDPAIFALGDAIEITDFVTKAPGFVALAGPANKQGRIAADNVAAPGLGHTGMSHAYKGTQGSSIMKLFEMTVACTGLSEKAAQRNGMKPGLDYEKSYTFPASHAGYYPGGEDMLIKILFSLKDGKLLGAQLIGGAGVDKRCDVLATAIRAGMSVYDLTELELCYAPPYSSAKDPVNMAGFVAEDILNGLVKVCHWHDIAVLQKESVQLVDVRTPEEYAEGHIEGFKNIPLDDLRKRLAEIDKTKPVCVTCRVGLRGYVAARILMQHGFKDVRNLSGGYRLYQAVN